MTKPLELTPPPANLGTMAFWPTPAWVTEALLERDPPDSAWVIEPSAGDGGIADILQQYTHTVWAIEIRNKCIGRLDDLLRIGDIRPGYVSQTDWLKVSRLSIEAKIDYREFSIVGNPPWDPAPTMLAHVKHCLEVGAEYVALLLPLRFLCSQSRAPFHAEHPVNALYPIARRIDFGGTGGGGKQDCAWFVWRKGCTAQKVEVIP